MLAFKTEKGARDQDRETEYLLLSSEGLQLGPHTDFCAVKSRSNLQNDEITGLLLQWILNGNVCYCSQPVDFLLSEIQEIILIPSKMVLGRKKKSDLSEYAKCGRKSTSKKAKNTGTHLARLDAQCPHDL